MLGAQRSSDNVQASDGITTADLFLTNQFVEEKTK